MFGTKKIIKRLDVIDQRINNMIDMFDLALNVAKSYESEITELRMVNSDMEDQAISLQESYDSKIQVMSTAIAMYRTLVTGYAPIHEQLKLQELFQSLESQNSVPASFMNSVQLDSDYIDRLKSKQANAASEYQQVFESTMQEPVDNLQPFEEAEDYEEDPRKKQSMEDILAKAAARKKKRGAEDEK